MTIQINKYIFRLNSNCNIALITNFALIIKVKNLITNISKIKKDE